MKPIRRVLFTLGLICISQDQAFAKLQMISCPNLSAAHYGRSSYYDQSTGKSWHLAWHRNSARQKPVWESVSIPKAATCHSGRSSAGLSFKYQCVVLQCESPQVIAHLGKSAGLKCYSAYISNQNTFYCANFSTI